MKIWDVLSLQKVLLNGAVLNPMCRRPGASVVKNTSANAGDTGLIPGSGRFPGEENGNPRQYSCLENSMDGGTWQATVHGVTKSQIRQGD